jgi:hypothetical protein
MKWIKLFENFSIDDIIKNNKLAIDIVEDTKAISYILDEVGFTLNYSFLIAPNKFDRSSFECSVDNYNNISEKGGRRMIDSITILIIYDELGSFQRSLKDSEVNKIDRYIDLLKVQLDYIDPENITKRISGMGNTNIVIKL